MDTTAFSSLSRPATKTTPPFDSSKMQLTSATKRLLVEAKEAWKHFRSPEVIHARRALTNIQEQVGTDDISECVSRHKEATDLLQTLGVVEPTPRVRRTKRSESRCNIAQPVGGEAKPRKRRRRNAPGTPRSNSPTPERAKALFEKVRAEEHGTYVPGPLIYRGLDMSESFLRNHKNKPAAEWSPHLLDQLHKTVEGGRSAFTRVSVLRWLQQYCDVSDEELVQAGALPAACPSALSTSAGRA